jgi:hypothetical protein
MRRMRWTVAAGVAVFLGTVGIRAWAQTGPLMRAVAMPGLVPAIVAQLAPLTIELPAGRTDVAVPRIRIVGLTWCGGDGAGGARALGIVYPEEAATPPSNALSAADCDRDLASIAARLPLANAHAPWAAVIKMRATWRPWRLVLAVVDAAGAGSGNPAAALKTLGEFKSIATAGLRVLPPPGDRYSFDLALKFNSATIVAALFPAGGVADPDPYLGDDPTLRAETASIPAGANLVADAQYAFINEMLRLYAPVYEVPFQVQGMNQPITVRNVTAAGGDNTMRLRGEIGYAGLAYNAAMVANGEDLRIASIELEAESQAACDQDDMIARLQCQANQITNGGAARALAAGLTNYYQGQPFHYSTGNRPLRFVLGDVEFAADLQALKSSSRGAIFNEDGRASIRRLGAIGAR